MKNKGKNFCMAPWTHMSVWQQGNAYPCCIYDWQDPIGNINDAGIKGVWNSEKMKTLRLNMLADKVSPGCDRCNTLDDVGIYSYRRKMNDDFSHHADLIETTNIDGSVDKVNLAYFDIRFSNLCNMKCRSCGPHFSSKWAEDTKGKPYVIEINHKDLWTEIEEYIYMIEEVYFTGGESLFMDQHYRLLDMLIQAGRSPKLVYNSNGSRLEHKGKHIQDYWKHIDNRIEFRVSLDQYGKKAEYTRHGQLWSTIENNLKYIKENIKNVGIYPSPTISVLNILDLKDLMFYLFDNKLATDYDINLSNLCMSPEWLDIQILPKDIKKQAEKNLLSILTGIKNYPMKKKFIDYYNENIPRIIEYMHEKDRTDLIPEFKKQMKHIDRIRNENFLDVFPELGELYE